MRNGVDPRMKPRIQYPRFSVSGRLLLISIMLLGQSSTLALFPYL